MSQIVVDTDVVSFLFKNHSLAVLYDPEIARHVPVISFMTVAELNRWALQSAWSQARVKALQWHIDSFVIAPSTAELCWKWAEVMVAAQACGRRIEMADAW